jgi:hypothetical protein
MPTLTVSTIRKEVKSPLDSPTKLGPPDFLLVIEFLFHILEGMGMQPPAAEWFAAEAFAALHIQNFKPSPELQHFLHQFLGSAYYDGYSVTSYYLPVLYAYILHHMFVGIGHEKVVGRMRAVLGMWNIREKEAIIGITERWLPHTIEKLTRVTPLQSSPHAMYTIAYERVSILQKRGEKLGKSCYFIQST